MGGISVWIVLLIWLIPIVLIARSSKLAVAKKNRLAISYHFYFMVFNCFFYFLLAPLKSK